MSHPRHELNALIHSPVRFSIMGYLGSVDECEFSILRDAVDLSDSSLSQNLTRLDDAGFITIEKRQYGRQMRTWIASTEAGNQALEHNLAILRDIAGNGPDQE
ncbi:transcriptional regulator [Arthrobacter sp.]|uniref:transcriptional regulator n=1 Tax=Arthrobacter sp. TaxID=1667 RepID=UPI002896B200|nr:transcriptional regulator [Arthrobacter sp.]